MENGIAEMAAELVQRIKMQVEFAERGTARQQASTSVQPRLLTVKQAAEYIGRSEQAVRHLIFQRDIPVVRTGRCVRLDRRDVDRWIENNKA